MVNVKVRTRYAPSPTGLFHIGGARTALFSYLFAKHCHGDFVVRIENTDTNRNVENGVQSQLDNLKWLGIFADESPTNPGSFGPYQQSEKLDVYQNFANKLVEEGKAYRCFCDTETLEKMRDEAVKLGQTPKYDRRCLKLSKEQIDAYLAEERPYSIRIKIPDDVFFGWIDLIRGKVTIPSSSMSDIVILKSNGIATYNFAVVIDDVQMQITHVIRGEEHLTNTAYQLLVADCLNALGTIQYGHLSVITDFSGKKLSKRSGNADCFIETYRNLGYLPEAIVNFLLLLGWSSPEGTKEIYSINEAIEIFEVEDLNRAPSIFDYNKLKWLNHEYMKKMDDNSFLSFVELYLKPNLLDGVEKKDEALLLFKNQLEYAAQINDLVPQFFPKQIAGFEVKRIINSLKFDEKNVHSVLKIFKDNLSIIKEWNLDNVSLCIKNSRISSKMVGKDFFQPIRIALTGKTHGPEFAGVVYVLGKERCLKLINSVLEVLLK